MRLGTERGAGSHLCRVCGPPRPGGLDYIESFFNRVMGTSSTLPHFIEKIPRTLRNRGSNRHHCHVCRASRVAGECRNVRASPGAREVCPVVQELSVARKAWREACQRVCYDIEVVPDPAPGRPLRQASFPPVHPAALSPALDDAASGRCWDRLIPPRHYRIPAGRRARPAPAWPGLVVEPSRGHRHQS